MKTRKQNTLKKAVNKNLSSVQKMFANAIDYKALEKAMDDPGFIAIIKKIRI